MSHYFSLQQKRYAIELGLILVVGVVVGILYTFGLKNKTLAYPFIPRIDYTGTLAKYSKIATGDFDGDGKLDLVASSYAGNRLAYLKGNGDSTFQTITYISALGNTSDIFAYDINNDTFLDIVTINNVSALYTVLGNGNGTFQTPIATPVGLAVNSMKIDDINNDGFKDIIGLSTSLNRMYVFKGIISAPYFDFAPAVDVPTGATPSGIATKDLNSDGFKDVVITNNNSISASIYYSDINANLTFNTDLVTGIGPVGVLISDVNHDNLEDIVTVNQTGNTISVFLNNHTSGFVSNGTFSTGAAGSQIINFDVNGDGYQDLAVTNVADSTVSVLVGNGLGQFSIDTIFPVGVNPNGLLYADFNEDGNIDIATANGNGRSISILTNTPQPKIVLTPIGGSLAAAEGGGSVQLLTALLGKAPTAQVDITLANLDGQLAYAKPGICFVPDALSLPGTGANAPCTVWNDPQIISVVAIDDLALEGVHTGVIRASAASADIGYNGLQGPLQNVSITDNDTANLIINNGGSGTVNEGVTTGVTFNVTLGTVEPTADVTVAVGLTSPDPANVRVAVDVMTICFTNAINNTPGCVMWNTSVPVTITPISPDDTTFQTNQDYSITLNTTSTDPNYNTRTGVVAVGWRDNDAAPESGGGGGRKFGVTQPIMVALNEAYIKVAEDTNAVNNYLASVSALQTANSLAKQAINKDVIAVAPPVETNEIIIEEITTEKPKELVVKETFNELVIPKEIIEKEINIIQIPRVALGKPYVIKSVIPVTPESVIRGFEISETNAIPVDTLALSDESRDLACKYGTKNIYTQHDGSEYMQDNTDQYHKKYLLDPLCGERGEYYTVNHGVIPERNIAMNQDELIPKVPIKASSGPLAAIPVGTTIAFGGLTTAAVIRKKNKIQQFIEWIGNMV